MANIDGLEMVVFLVRHLVRLKMANFINTSQHDSTNGFVSLILYLTKLSQHMIKDIPEPAFNLEQIITQLKSVIS